MSEEENRAFWKAVQCTVEKDVVRTDRCHLYFSGEGNPNIDILKYILIFLPIMTHTHTFKGSLSGTTWVSRYHKGKPNLDFTEARDSEWQWHLLGHMQVCTSLQSDNHPSTPPFSFLQAGCPSCHPTNSVKALKANHAYHDFSVFLLSSVRHCWLGLGNGIWHVKHPVDLLVGEKSLWENFVDCQTRF